MKPDAPFPAYQPLYRQIKLLITEGLESGQWKPGESIPSELELAKRFNVSQGTVRKAVNELAQENVLVRRQGRGTFVASHAHERAQLAFLRITPDAGPVATIEAELVECRRVRADAAAARNLDLETGSPLVRVRRVLSVNAKRVIYEEAKVPAELFPGLDAETLNAHGCMLYTIYESEFHVRIVEAEERLKAVAADADTAHPLGLREGAPLLMMERVAYTYGRRPVELRRSFCNCAEHHYANIIN
ncbi:MAG: UTRA domain-containing protein [Betaproteobacteria bacterium]|nr:UTRA domain-containing protein [Betaproteobacteria bacterium]